MTGNIVFFTGFERTIQVYSILNGIFKINQFMRFFPLYIFTLATLLFNVSYSRTLNVFNGDHISPVLKRATSGDTVLIQKGTYKENLVIDIPLIIKGQDHPVIKGNYTGHVILVKANGTVIEGLLISEAGARLIDDMACVRVEADSVTIRFNTITKPLHGIYVKGGSYTTIHDNTIEGRLDLITADRGNGIHLWNSKKNTLFNNEIFNVRDGIYFSFADSTTVNQNYIHNVRYGLHYMYSKVNSFEDNVFENNVAGAALMYSQGIEFYRNVFAQCRGFRAYGLLYQSMDNAIARDNLIIDNSRGVFFDNSNFNLFEQNDVVDNDLAIQMMGSGEENAVIKNNFINNLSNLLVDGKESKTVWAKKDGGNFWSNYHGYDLDGDGLGDVPFKIQNVFQVMETKIPEIRFYLNSPAAQILEVAERSLPILDLGTESDPVPVVKPLKNERVPWDKTKELLFSGSPFFALIYFILFLFSAIIVFYRKNWFK